MTSFRMTSEPQVNAGDIWKDSATQEHELGAKIVGNDGSAYRYVKAGATALVPGKLYDGPAIVANHVNIAVAVAAAVGATSVTVTLGATAATANQYAGGKLIISDANGEGYTYHIDSNPAADASASLVLTLSPATPIKVALTTSSEATLIANQFNGVIIHAATETGVPVGIATKAITAAQYGWIQTRGAVSALSDATVSTTGDSVAASASTAGATTVGTGVLSPIGYALTAGVDTEYRPIYLTID